MHNLHMFPQFASKKVLFCTVLLAITQAFAQTVATQHNDNARTGQNTQETFLKPTNVISNRFGKISSLNVDGVIVGQPLFVPGVSFPGSLGVHDAVYVATQHDSVYAFDAQGVVAAPLWHVSFINGVNILTETITQQGCPETAYTEIGIMGTPVIDVAGGTLYVVAKTVENGVFVFHLHALDLGTGAEKFAGPVQITASVTNSSGTTVNLNPSRTAQRPGLLLTNGMVYIGFGSNGCDTFPGWVMAYDANTLQQLAALDLDPNEAQGASVWQSGMGIAADSISTNNTNNLYFATANGAFDWSTGDCGECVLRLGNSLTLSDYFAPANRDFLDANDLDFGSGGVLLLPDQNSSPVHLLVAAGKEGTIYLLDRDNLGQYSSTDQVVQELPAGIPQVLGGGTGPAYWNGFIYYVTTKGLRMFSLTNGLLSSVSIPKSANSMSGKGLPSVSAKGTSNGILWVLRGSSYLAPQLAAYNASNLTQLYSSAQAPNGRDTLPAIAHFATPTIAGGRVYIGTQTQLVIYGLLPSLNIWYGNNQSAPAGTTLSKPLEVKAVNQYTGAAIPGVIVTFSDGGIGGTFSSPNAVTDSNGVASTNYTLPSTPQLISVTASSSGFGGATFRETAQ